MDIKWIDGGVTAPKGFKASGVHAGIRRNKMKKDLALIVAEKPCVASAVYTRNKVFGAPITVTRKNLENGIAEAVICNSGNANTCNADGVEKAAAMTKLVELHTGIKSENVIVASTGVIGQTLPIEPIENAMSSLVGALSLEGSGDAANAIMTTDTVKKEFAVETVIDGKMVRIGAIAKGSGMIHPNMATMLAFVTSDVSISKEMLDKVAKEVVDDTINMISVDGDTSTNDMMTVMASGLAGNAEIDCDGEDYKIFKEALFALLKKTAMTLAKDGEGATKLVECQVVGGSDVKIAKAIAKSVITSSLLKAALFASDANWGRILCAIGYTEGDFDITKVDVKLVSKVGEITVCENGSGVEFSEEKATKVLDTDEVTVYVDMKDGEASATAWGCDLTYDYVKINADYRT